MGAESLPVYRICETQRSAIRRIHRMRQYLQAGCFYYDLQAGRFFLKVTVFLLWAYGTAKFKTGREKYSDKIWFAVHGILKKQR